MRLTFVSAYYPPYGVGGAEESTFVLARALTARGHAVRVFAPRLGPEPPVGGVPVTTVDVGQAVTVPGAPLPPRAFDSIRLQMRLARAIKRAAADADVVHCQALAVLPAAYLAARRSGVPIVATIRDLAGVCPVSVCLLTHDRVPADCGIVKLERTCVPEFRRLYETGSRFRFSAAALVRFLTARGRSFLLRRCDAVYSVGSDLGPLYAAAGLVDASKVDVLPNIAEPNGSKETTSDGAYAVYAGKVSHGKGVGHLVEATRLVRHAAPQFRLVVAGSADSEWRRRLAECEGLEYRGRLDREGLSALYAGARLAVVPSIWPEPFPRAVLEASAASVPVVATTAGGIPDAVVDGQTGLLVEPRNASALADSILRLWNDSVLARRMGAAAHDYVADRFSADAVCVRAEELYAAAAAGRAD